MDIETYILTVYDHDGNPIEIPALQGRGIENISRTSGNGAAGSRDIYTITYSDGTTSQFQIYNGKDGTPYTLTDADKSAIASAAAGMIDAPVTSVNGKTGAIQLKAADVGALPSDTKIPTKTSELTNDKGFITGYTESDPTVPSWAKQSKKPTYTADEVGARPSTWTPTASDVGALPATTTIPSKTSQLTDDVGYAKQNDVSRLSSAIVNLGTEVGGKLNKNFGAANVGKILVVGTDGNLVLTDMPESGVSGDVVGTLDDANNLLLEGNLPDGTYKLRYKLPDGTYTDAVDLVVSTIVAPTYTNVLDTAINPVDSSVLDGVGYRRNVRLSTTSPSTEPYKAESGYTCTGFIPVEQGVQRDWYIYGLNFTGASRCMIGLYNSKSNSYAGLSTTVLNDGVTSDLVASCTKLGDGYFKITTKSFSSKAHYMALCGATVSGVDPIVTKGEPIL